MGADSAGSAGEGGSMSDLITIDVTSEEVATPLCPDSYDYTRLPEELRDQAMLAQGTVLTKLKGAVERVIDAGNTLRWARETLPHGEYLPWVSQACGLKPQYAQRLIKAAKWSNAAHARHLDGVADTTTLFLLSADTTPEDVREWFMERCAAGNPPTRKEVQQRKRGTLERTIVHEALSALKLSPEARDLAAKAQHITTRQLMDELQVEELPKGREHSTSSATYCKNGTGWWKFPIQKPIEVKKEITASEQLVTVAFAAKTMGYSKPQALRCLLVPSRIQKRGLPRKNGWVAKPSLERGMCFISQQSE